VPGPALSIASSTELLVGVPAGVWRHSASPAPGWSQVDPVLEEFAQVGVIPVPEQGYGLALTTCRGPGPPSIAVQTGGRTLRWTQLDVAVVTP
jgi:hypothetical protein